MNRYSRVPNKRAGIFLENLKKNPTLSGTIRLFIFSKNTQLYVYSRDSLFPHIFLFIFVKYAYVHYVSYLLVYIYKAKEVFLSG